jgi:hypothetical protein
MDTIDNLLIKIVNFNSPTIEERIHSRDSRVLRSLATSIKDNFFITENQSRLLTKILKENSEKIPEFSEEIKESLFAPRWSRAFRQIEQIRKLRIDKGVDDEPTIFIDFTFNSEIRKILVNLAKTADTLVQGNSQKLWTADLTEKNIIMLVNVLSSLEFDIDEKIQNHYNTIKSWSEPEIRDQFLLTNIVHQNFQKAITSDLGIETAIDLNIIHDRSMRYQYFTEHAKNPGETLTEVIANRSKSKVWIDNAQHTLTEVIGSLVELKRLPLLVVFDETEDDVSTKNLAKLVTALEENGIFDNVGIYFRLENNENGKKFNQTIALKQYNAKLDDATQVAGILSGKIPKFFLKNAWRPMSVLALETRMGLRHGKAAVYSNCCDLIIEYQSQPALAEERKLSLWS